ncbi:MAG: hypothetical protein B7X86_16125 [Sphingobacteriales bacterium 17-39-43]|uniref:hypothetical protein n=1 Tax=Daejeonella sp. TaxID=2805397 RepID=UPI000BDDD869|nr:hypothetical protein [Daejeonella sp.]OYZ29066.1 MAG: hypothetical protein B7Y24_15850 [Sphingobacteriales bacterium 16-39-50]OZA22310.1 MAG: hypothetical protein B7X86_16125 [Sphingobacteriales bacterium 17-39-43]HQS52946.1 hypothetical protein [Daejeonella sp.]HQT24525.1 hypothetical protein [Daejeonella sp.]HQT59320.1 hypothetical protein [Daejeonella sp.]
MTYFKLIFRNSLFILVLTGSLNILQAQILVHEEPRHRPVFQSKEIRILNVRVAPGDTSLYHMHTTPSFFIRLTNTITGSQVQGEAKKAGKSQSGEIRFENLAPPNNRVHRVWNADKDTFHVMDVELLMKKAAFDQKPLNLPNLKLEIDTNWVRAYRLNLLKGIDFKTKNKQQSLVLVSLNPSTLEITQNGKTGLQALKPGSFFVIKRRQSFSVKNTSEISTQFVLLELPPK